MTSEVEYDCSIVVAICHNTLHYKGFAVSVTTTETFAPTTIDNPYLVR
jgi:hypothetical protein